MTTLDGLLAVQERDTEIDQLRHRRATLPARTTLADLENAGVALASRLAEVSAERGDFEDRRAELEKEVSELEQRLKDLDRRMRSGEVTATRELTAMVEQSDSLKRRRTGLEDEELELMVALEPLDEELADVGRRGTELSQQIEGLRVELAQAETELDRELAAATEDRELAASGLPDNLMATYERLRQRLGGVGAARLVGSSCSGCHLVLSATEVDRIRRESPDALILCEQCGRILVR
jgi:predicted  nucleic acid-binding Zn-ribbon protein